jgi:hypothetical protein
MDSAQGDSVNASDLAGLTIQELIIQKRNAITVLDFERAAVIEKQILQNRKEQLDSAVQTSLNRLSECIESTFQILEDERTKTRQAYEEKVQTARFETDITFQTLQNRHLAELTEIEKDYALSVLRENGRPVKEQAALNLLAQRLARANDFDESIRIREQGKIARELTIEERRAQVDTKFKKVRQVKLDQQRNELRILNTKLKAHLEIIEQERDNALAMEEVKFQVTCLAEQQKQILDASKRTKSEVEKRNIAQTICKFANQKVSALAGLVLNKATPTAPPKSTESPKGSRMSTRQVSAVGSGPIPVAEAPKSQPAIVPDEDEEEEEEEANEVDSTDAKPGDQQAPGNEGVLVDSTIPDETTTVAPPDSTEDLEPLTEAPLTNDPVSPEFHEPESAPDESPSDDAPEESGEPQAIPEETVPNPPPADPVPENLSENPDQSEEPGDSGDAKQDDPIDATVESES